MDASSSVVIKVKCGDVLRRFSGQILNNELNLNMNGLKKKIVSLFNITPDTELVLTYIDEDNDIVTLVDDEDIRDVVRQTLNPLRIMVKLNSDKKEPKYDRFSGSSDPLVSPEVQLPLLDPGSGLSEIVMNLPVPLRGPITTLSADLIIDKTSSSALTNTHGRLSFIRKFGSSLLYTADTVINVLISVLSPLGNVLSSMLGEIITALDSAAASAPPPCVHCRKVDHGLCRVCFEKMGNRVDCVRMERAIQWPRDQPAMVLHSHSGSKAKHGSRRLDSCLIQDVNIVNGTVMPPATPFTKIWRMRNNGSAAWAPKTHLVWVGGDKMGNALTFELEIPCAGLLVGQEIDVAVDLISPQHPGRYVTRWSMASSTGQKFGQLVWVVIQVDASVKEAPRGSIKNLNLKLPPKSSISSLPTALEIVDICSA